MAIRNQQASALLSTGVPGLDTILGGGLFRDRLYLVEGQPGTGKTTVALQFLLEGARQGESVMYITLSETEDEVRAIAQSHGWDIQGLHIHEVIPAEDLLDPGEQYSMFHPSEVELASTTRAILAAVERFRPRRLVIDSLSELQLLAGSSLRYRRQVLAYKQFFATRSCTVMMLDDCTTPDSGMQVRSIAHGVIALSETIMDYGAERRRIRIAKYRGMAFRGGQHDYAIERGGLKVYPRLVASATRSLAPTELLGTGVEELDLLLGGGIESGTSTLVSGPPGTGKSVLAAQIAAAAVERGGKAAMFLFEESSATLLRRSDGIGMQLRGALDSGALSVQQVDPAELSPGQLAATVCEAADRGVRVVVFDSLNGYLNAMPDERFLLIHLHEILTYLGQRGIVTILVGVQQGMLGNTLSNAVDASYLADNVVLLRYFEAAGEVRQAISVFKKRAGQHERSIRQFSMSSEGIHVGPVLRQFHGILTGVPTLTIGGEAEGLLHNA